VIFIAYLIIALELAARREPDGTALWASI